MGNVFWPLLVRVLTIVMTLAVLHANKKVNQYQEKLPPAKGAQAIPTPEIGPKDCLQARYEAALHELTAMKREHDRWKRAAESLAGQVRKLVAAARAQPPAQNDANDPSRFRRLRFIIASEFHPDHVTAEGLEKIIRTEVFKSIWPRVQKLDQEG